MSLKCNLNEFKRFQTETINLSKILKNKKDKKTSLYNID